MTITNFLALSEEDLIEWEDNPEQYVLKQDSLTIYERLRPAAENLYLSLVERFQNLLVHFLYKQFYINMNPPFLTIIIVRKQQ